MVHPDLQAEQVKVDYAYDCLDAMVRATGDVPAAAAHPKVAHHFQNFSRKVLDRLSDDDQLCLGRIDPGEGEPLYVGRFGVHDERNDVVLVNWQLPSVGAFWTATPTDPKGLTSKRAFQTQERVLLEIFEDRFDGVEVAVAPDARGIDDLLLNELQRERGEQMRDIVATIREDQYRLMSAPMEGVLVIQGAPGTGKTAVGLHRASWLMFNHRAELEAARVLIVGPNRIFMHYVAGVLPSLGDDGADQSAVQYLVAGSRARAEEPPPIARVKGDSVMATVVADEIWGRVGDVSKLRAISLDGRSIEVEPDLVTDLVASAQRAAPTYMQGRRVFVDQFRNALYDAARAKGVTRPHDDFVYALNQYSDFRTIVDGIWPRLSPTQAIRELLGSRDRLSRAAGGLLSPGAIDLLYRRNPDKEADVAWTEHDLPLIDEAETVLNGIEERYGHLIVDEAQDLTPMQLRMVGRRVRSASVTVLGDIAQATGVFAYSSWAEVTEHLGWGKGNVEELSHAYRVPRQIMELAVPTLRAIAPGLTDPQPYRDGKSPEIREIGRPFLGEEAAFEAQACLELGGTVGIISPDSLVEEIRAALEHAGAEYGEASRGDLGGGIELLTPRMAKGLEFDHVVLAEPLAVLRESTAAEPLRELYVTLTRPTQTLVVLHSEPLPEVLGGAAELPGGLADAPLSPEGPPSEAAPLGPRISDALAYARLVGARDSGTARAVERGLAVAGLLLEANEVEEEVIAALILPVVSGNGGDAIGDIRRLFGPGVAEALARSQDSPDDSPIVLADTLRGALIGALANNDAEIVIDRLQQLAATPEE
jgi:DNA helicase IV